MLVGLAGGLLTATVPLWPESGALQVLGAPLGFGLLLGSVPFGGLHNAPPLVPLFILASVINAALWGGVFLVASRIVRLVRG